MVDYTAARRRMVDCQLRTNNVTDLSVINAFLDVPREKFVPASKRNLAYIDHAFEIRAGDGDGPARYMMAPMQLAKLIHLAEIDVDDVVLIIGCGAGYAATIVSVLAESVVAVEPDETLVENASTVIDEIGASNIAVVAGGLAEGFPSEGPYDVILINGAVDHVPDTLTSQLKEGGRLVAVTGSGGSAAAHLYLSSGGNVSRRFAFNCSVPHLPGFEKETEFVF